MGPVDWIGVLLAALAALIVAGGWYRIFGRAMIANVGPGGLEMRRNPLGVILGTFLLVLISATMLGHMFARIDPARWWLFPMMSGGVALTFVIPALWTNYLHRRTPRNQSLIDAGYWLLTYLAMGLVFLARAG